MNHSFRFYCVVLSLLLLGNFTQLRAGGTGKEYYQIKIYTLGSNEQVAQVDAFLEQAYLPALKRMGISKVGVFKQVGIDTTKTKEVYVFIPLSSLELLNTLERRLCADPKFLKDGASYLNLTFDQPAYRRMESVVLSAFKMMPRFKVPSLKGIQSERIYELRSYEAATEKLYRKKVEMFNEGGEVALFNRLGFNAVFYGEVLAGSKMPNLMYMTSFDNMESRDAHWKTFVADPEWKRLSALPEYQHTVSKADIILLHPAAYSGM